jgi:hypothetical protein
MNTTKGYEPTTEEWAKWVENRRRFLIETAGSPPSEPIPFLTTVHEVWKWLFAIKELKAQVAESDFQLLYGVVQECRDLALGTERQYWAAESLREKDLMARAIENRVREDVLPAFARIANDLTRML